MKDAHLHVRLEARLLEQVRGYAAKQHKTVTQLVVEHLRYLLSVDVVQDGMISALKETERMRNGIRTGKRSR
jgi:hypothetical protein